MSVDIGPGDWVEVVKVSPNGRGRSGARLGHVYIVEEVGACVSYSWINCQGIKRPRETFPADHPHYHAPGWEISCFRPIHRPGQSTLIADLKRMADGPIKVGV